MEPPRGERKRPDALSGWVSVYERNCMRFATGWRIGVRARTRLAGGGVLRTFDTGVLRTLRHHQPFREGLPFSDWFGNRNT